MNFNSLVNVVRGIVKLRGGTDGTIVGNSSDSLKTSVTNTVDVAQATGTNLHAVIDSGNITDSADGPVTPGTAASKSQLSGGQYNSSLPTLTTGQQVAIQVDSSGRLIIRPLTSSDSISAVQSGTWNIGTVTAVTSVTNPVAVTESGTWTVQPGNTANSTPWLFTINQGGNSATVTASNALKVDGSAVTQPVSGTVSVNQNTSPWVVGVPADTTVSGTITALNGTVQMAIAGHKSEAIVLSGTWTATCVIEYSSDGGTTWVPGAVHANVGYATNLGINTVLLYATMTTNGTYYNSSSGGHTHLRIRASAFTSGTINVQILGVEGANSTIFGQMNISQTEVISTNNSSTSNLTSGSSFTGILDNTLSFNAIQVSLFCDQPTTLHIQQSSNGINWDIDDIYEINASVGTSTTVKTTAQYFRTIVTNNGPSTTTSLRLQSILCPVVEPLPRSLTNGGDLSVDVHAQSYNEELPHPQRYPEGRGSLVTDEDGRLETHSTVSSDLETFRDDFSGTSLLTTLTGTVYFTNGSDLIRGIGTSFTSQVKIGQFIRKSSDTPGETVYFRIDSIESDIILHIEKAYTGTTQGTTAVVSNWLDFSSAIISLNNSILTFSSGTSAGFKRIEREAKFPSNHIVFKLAVSQRIANQTIRVGSMGDSDADTPMTQACVVFDGTDNTVIKLRTASSSNSYDLMDNSITLPTGLNTSQYLTYSLDISKDSVTLSVNNKIVAINNEHIPDPYYDVELGVDITNSTTVTNTDVTLDYFYSSRLSRVEIKHTFTGTPIESTLYGISPSTNLPLPLQVDNQGRIVTVTNIVSPLSSTYLTKDIFISPGSTIYTSYTATQQLAIKQFYAGGTGIGKQTAYLYTPTTSQFINSGDFETTGDVANWPYFSAGGGGTGTTALSTAQFFTGTHSISVTFTTSDANHSNGILQTFGTVQDFSLWRYITAEFYNTVSAGGAYTRTIQIVLTDTAANTRTYSVSGLSTASPFNTAGWIEINGEIENPTSSTGSTFDITNIASIELRQFDSANRAGTTYWDTVKLKSGLSPILPIFHQANVSFNIPVDPVIILNINDSIIVAQKNNDTARKEYYALVGMVATS